MKKLVLLFAMSILSNGMFASGAFRPMWKTIDEPVKITVRGIDFFIFPNGEFDFNAHQRHNGNYYNPGEYGVRVEKDRYGKIRRIGNVFLNYNRYRQISRIGNVFVKYNYQGMVERVGRIHLRYSGRRYYIVRRRHYNPYAYNWNWGSNYYYGPASGYTNNSYSYSNNNYYNDNINDYDDYYSNNDESDDYYFRGNNQGKNKKVKKVKVKNRRR